MRSNSRTCGGQIVCHRLQAVHDEKPPPAARTAPRGANSRELTRLLATTRSMITPHLAPKGRNRGPTGNDPKAAAGGILRRKHLLVG
jgi:hypothetical protein